MTKKAEIQKLATENKYTDVEIAEITETSKTYVAKCRMEGAIPVHKKLTLFEKLLGKKTDKQISEETGMSYNSVIRARLRRGVPPVKKTHCIPQRIGEICLGIYPFLGILPDKKIAEITKKSMRSAIKKRYKENIKPAAVYGERKLQDVFARTLINPSENVPTASGIIDILCDNAIYELKTPLTTSASHSAVGQLLAYSNEYSDRSLFIVTDKNMLNSSTIKHIQNLGIRILVISNS